MKTALRHLAMIVALFLVAMPSHAWNRRIHSAIAYIAEQHLTPKAKKTVSEILEGKSMVYYASWLDDYRKEMKVEQRDENGNILKKGAIPHGVRVGKDGKVYLTYNRDGIAVINKSVENLRDYRNLDDSTRLASMQCIIHLVGDIHCPAHLRHPEFDTEKGRKMYDRATVLYDKKKVRMHKVWDAMVVDGTTAGGVYDLAYIVDRATRKQVKNIQAGTVLDWGQETVEVSKNLWYVRDGEKLTKKYLLDNRELAFEQIQKAGLRLAKVMNDLFD